MSSSADRDLASSPQQARRTSVGHPPAAPGPEINDVVGAANDSLFMLDDDERVSLVAQCVHDLNQPPVSRGCSPTVGSSMTKSVLTNEAPRQGGEIDALDLAAGERAGRAVQCEITESDLVHIAQPGENLVLQQNRVGSAGGSRTEAISACKSRKGVAATSGSVLCTGSMRKLSASG